MPDALAASSGSRPLPRNIHLTGELAPNPAVLPLTRDGLTILPHPSPWVNMPFYLDSRLGDFHDPHGDWEADQGPIRMLGYTRPQGWHYEEMELVDGDLAAAAGRAVDEVLAIPQILRKGDADPATDLVHQFTCWCVEQFDEEWDAALRHLAHDGFCKGLAILEVIWQRVEAGPWSGYWQPVRLEPRPMWRFEFVATKRGPVLYYYSELGELKPAPLYRFLLFRPNGGESPYGKAIYDSYYTDWYDKRYSAYFRAQDEERWARPHAATGYKRVTSGDTAEKENRERRQQAMELSKGIHGDAELAYDSDVFEPKILGVSRPGASTYLPSIEANNRTGERLLFGETQISGSNRSTGSLASFQVSDEVARRKVKWRARMLEKTVSRFFRWIKILNFAIGKPSRLVIRVLDGKDQSDLREGVELSMRVGKPVGDDHMTLVTGVPEAAPGEKTYSEPREKAA